MNAGFNIMPCHTCVLTGGQFKSRSPFESMTEFGRGGSGWGYFTAGGETKWSAKTGEEARKKVQDFLYSKTHPQNRQSQTQEVG